MIRGRGGLGELRDRIELARKKRVPVGDVGFAETFVTVAAVWARFEQLGGSAFMDDAAAGDNGGPGATHTFVIRYRLGLELPDVTTYVFWKGRRLKLSKVRQNDARGDFMTLFCEVQETVEDDA